MNRATHELVKGASKEVLDKIWMEETSPSIFDTIVLERLALVILSLVTLDSFFSMK